MRAGPAASGAVHDGKALRNRELEALLQEGPFYAADGHPGSRRSTRAAVKTFR
jgi:hypothetical protein